MTTPEQALQFTSGGMAVFPVYAPTLEGRCTCPNPLCKSPGKHPYGPKAPTGVNAASIEEAYVRDFFDSEGLNIGVACGQVSGGLMVQDIDDEEIAERLLAPEVGLREMTRCDTTGRGLHIWLYTSGSTKGQNLAREGGGPIGELRGDGQYVVAPPSQHYSGRSYEWINDLQILYTEDARKWVIDLLTRIGIEVADPTKYADIEFPDGVILFPQSLPTIVEGDTEIVRLAKGPIKRPDGKPDRSRDLYRLAHLLVERSWGKRARIPTNSIAGILKQVDSIPGYQKYSSRPDSDRQYYYLARMSEEDWEERNLAVLSVGGYNWNRTDLRLFWESANGRIQNDIANFLPTIQEELEIERGDDEEPTKAYVIKFERADGESFTFTLKGESERDLMNSAWMRPPAYVVEPDKWKHVWAAAQHFSNNLQITVKRQSYAHTGWVEQDGRSMFLLCSMDGAISSNGMEPSLRFEDEKAPPAFLTYGKGVRPASTDEDWQVAKDAFRDLLDAGAAHVVIPILAQVFGGPLASLGLKSSPPLVHVTGETGSYKTSYSMAALSMYGGFVRDTEPPDNYESTAATIEHTLHYLKDLPVLIDNFIPGRRDSQALVGVVQAYGDGSSRGRMTATSTRRAAKNPRSLWLSTGESVWGENVSVRARTVIVWIAKGDILLEDLQRAQEHARVGHTGILGGSYISWLARRSLAAIRAMVEFEKTRALTYVNRTAIKNEHTRPAQSMANLIAAFQVARMFVKETMPELEAKFAARGKEGFDALLTTVERDAKEASLMSAWNQFTEALHSEITADRIKLAGRTMNESNYGLAIAQTVGWLDQRHVYLNEATSFAWFSERLHRQGSRPAFNWASFKDEALTKHGAFMTEPIRVAGQPRTLRLLCVTRDEFMSALMRSAGETGQDDEASTE